MKWVKVFENVDYNKLEANLRKTIDGLAGGVVVIDDVLHCVNRVDRIRTGKSQYGIWLVVDDMGQFSNEKGAVHLSSLEIRDIDRDPRAVDVSGDVRTFLWANMRKYNSYVSAGDEYTESVYVDGDGEVTFMLHNESSGVVRYASSPYDLPETLPDYYDSQDEQ